jgi:hypothetical protein
LKTRSKQPLGSLTFDIELPGPVNYFFPNFQQHLAEEQTSLPAKNIIITNPAKTLVCNKSSIEVTATLENLIVFHLMLQRDKLECLFLANTNNKRLVDTMSSGANVIKLLQ